MKNWLRKRKPVLNIGQLARLSNIFDNAGQVIFGVAILSPIISGIDKESSLVLSLGAVIVIVCWITSIWLAKRGE